MADTDTMGGNVNGSDRSTGESDLATLTEDSVRPAERRDIKYIAQIARDYEGNKWSWTPEVVARDLQYFFVEGQPVHGFVRAEPKSGSLLLTLIAVHKNARKRGVATRLLEAMEAIAETAGLDGVINLGPKTPEITKLYMKLGYKEIDRIKDAWGEGVDAVVLFKEV